MSEQLMPIPASVLIYDAEVAELAVLLPRRQAAALERVAQRRGLTTGQLMRRLICDYLASDEVLSEIFAIHHW